MTADFFKNQMDYIRFLDGMTFVLLAAVCGILFRRTGRQVQRLRWEWLGLFAVLHGVSEWVDLAKIALGHDFIFMVVRLCLMIPSYLFLMEFGRAGMVVIRGGGTSRWAFVPLLCVAAAGGFAGLEGLNITSRYALALTGGLWAAWHSKRAPANHLRCIHPG